MVTHRHVRLNGINMRVAGQGEGPLVLLLHGWPETWYSWRYQIGALSAAGYRVVAPDQRGYDATGRPDAVDQYSIFHLNGHANTSEDLVRTLGQGLRSSPQSPRPTADPDLWRRPALRGASEQRRDHRA